MFCVVYEFRVDPEFEELFQNAWHKLTQAMIREHGSLGARLHKSDDDDLVWIAYAQWPDRGNWQSGHELIDARTKELHLDKCLTAVPRILLKLGVIDDLLQLPGPR